jgi:predicted PhzF superfamily epimerase YddE/YHI9
MKTPIYQVDAFASRVFGGNPAAVCPLGAWLPDGTLQAIAAENNLSETAFIVARDGDYEIRWFTPTTEVDLCGHATLASAFIVFTELEPSRQQVLFRSRGGPLGVERDADLLRLDLPARPASPCPPPAGLAVALGREPEEVWLARALMAVFADEETVRDLRPDMAGIRALEAYATIVTAPGRDCDFVSRFFAPSHGIAEDPVTGSAHCTLVPYWARRLGRSRLQARQVSARGGELQCEDRGDRVALAGRAVKYLEGWIELSDDSR